jgi:hypothetical protein
MGPMPRFGWLVICYHQGVSAFPPNNMLLLSSVSSRFVALKIAVADITEGSHEALILKSLADKDAGTGSQHILKLLDNFQIKGPNGLHEVFITEVLVPLSAFARYSIYGQVRDINSI